MNPLLVGPGPGPKKTQPEELVLDNQDQDFGPDMSALMSVAYRDPDAPKVKSRFGTRKSKFWFRVESLKEEVDRHKELFKPRELEHVDSAVQNRLKTYKKELPPELKMKIDQVREFFLKEVAPLTVGSGAGTFQSRAVVEQLLDTKVDSALFSKFENMVNRAAVMKLARFVLRYFDLPAEDLQYLFTQQQSNPEAELVKVMQQMKTMMEQEHRSTSSNRLIGHKGNSDEQRRNRPSRR